MKFGTYDTDIDPRVETHERQLGAFARFARGRSGHGTRWRFTFPSGYGASVIDYGWGSEQGLYELAVIGPDGELDYTTPITSDVEGHLTPDDVGRLLAQIEQIEIVKGEVIP